MTRLVIAALAAACLASACLPLGAAAQSYPTKPVRFVVPFTPGGTTDILARVLGAKLSEALGQQFVVENKPGAGGTIGTELVVRAPADGYMLMMGHIGTLAVNPGLYPKLSYDVLKDLQPVTLVAIVPNVLVVHPSVPATDVKALIALAKAKPGELTFGSGGNGSAAHIAMAAFAHASGTQLTHVPYRGTGPMITDLISGQLNATLTGGPAVLQFVRNGQLRALAVSSLARLSIAKELPTIAEGALPGFEATQWYGVVAPAGMPAPLVAQLNAEIHKILRAPDVLERLSNEGADPSPGTPEQFRALIASEIQRWGDLIRQTGLKPD